MSRIKLLSRNLTVAALALTVPALTVAARAQSPFDLDPGSPDFGGPARPALPGIDIVPRDDPDAMGADDFEAEAAGKGDRADRAIAQTAAERREARLDRMFEQLATADSKERADRIGRHILRRLTQSGSDTVDLLMTRAGVAMEAENYGLALDLLDGVVRMEPEFAEGWNRRATANFMAGNFGQSVADIEQTLRYEPRHWGAILGLSMILVSLERNGEAIAMMDRALAIHPFLDELKERRERLAREVAADL